MRIGESTGGPIRVLCGIYIYTYIHSVVKLPRAKRVKKVQKTTIYNNHSSRNNKKNNNKYIHEVYEAN